MGARRVAVAVFGGPLARASWHAAARTYVHRSGSCWRALSDRARSWRVQCISCCNVCGAVLWLGHVCVSVCLSVRVCAVACACTPVASVSGGGKGGVAGLVRVQTAACERGVAGKWAWCFLAAVQRGLVGGLALLHLQRQTVWRWRGAALWVSHKACARGRQGLTAIAVGRAMTCVLSQVAALPRNPLQQHMHAGPADAPPRVVQRVHCLVACWLLTSAPGYCFGWCMAATRSTIGAKGRSRRGVGVCPSWRPWRLCVM
jgi:hypothetical protein